MWCAWRIIALNVYGIWSITAMNRLKKLKRLVRRSKHKYKNSGFGHLGVACWPLVPKFAVSNPAEAVEIFREKKSSACLSSEGK
jgi:hypothetical protein